MDEVLQLLDDICAAAALPDATLSDKMAAAAMLLSHGFVARARALLMTLLQQPPEGQNTLLDLCRRLQDGMQLLDTGPGDDAPGEVLLAPAPGAWRLLLLFPGVGGRFWGVNSFALLRRHGLHLLFLRLRTERFYLAGIDGLGDTYPGCIAELQRIIGALADDAGLNALEVHCLGHSFGGYAALRFGLDLGATSVLAFSAPTTLDISGDRDYQLAIHPELRVLTEQAPDLAADLHTLYTAHPAPPSVTLCYGEHHAEDSVAATRMAGLACVRLEPLADYGGHDAMWETMQRGLFEPLVDRLLAGSSAPLMPPPLCSGGDM